MKKSPNFLSRSLLIAISFLFTIPLSAAVSEESYSKEVPPQPRNALTFADKSIRELTSLTNSKLLAAFQNGGMEPRFITFSTESSEIEILPAKEPAAPSMDDEVLQNDPIEFQDSQFPLTQAQSIDEIIDDISETVYPNIDPYLVRAIVWKESRYEITAVDPTGSYVGLMQIAKSVHQDRMEKLGVTDLFDPHQNIMVGMDLLNELYSKYEDNGLVLMMYNGQRNAIELFNQGKLTSYAESVMNKAEELRTEGCESS